MPYQVTAIMDGAGVHVLCRHVLVLAQERWEEPDMEFHHIGSASSTNGSAPERPTLASDDLEIDAAQGGANKVILFSVPGCLSYMKFFSMLQKCHMLCRPTILMA